MKSLRDRYLSPQRITGIIRRNCILFCKDYMEILMYPKFGAHEPGKKLTSEIIPVVEGIQHLDEALEEKKGAILLHLHFGAMQLVLPAIAHRGYPLAQVGQSRLALLQNLGKAGSNLFAQTQHKRKQFEESLPAKFFYIGKSVREIIRWLSDNKIVDIAADGRNGNRWIMTDFLGRKAYFPDGPFRLSNLTGAAILPTFIIRQQDNTHKIIIEKSINTEGELDGLKSNSPEMLLKRFLNLAEDYVKMYPCHFCTRLWVMHQEAPKLHHPLFLE